VTVYIYAAQNAPGVVRVNVYCHCLSQVAQKRIQTVLNRLTPKEEGESMDPELASALDRLGL
jgi:hypothetical protein